MFSAYAFGYAYGALAGQLIGPVIYLLHKSVETKEETKEETEYEKHRWQPPIVGIIERTLYISSLLSGYAQFIGFWIALKVAIPYFFWEKKDTRARVAYMNCIIGNGLSVLYAAVGFKCIKWLNQDPWPYAAYAAIVSVLLILATYCLFCYVKKIPKAPKSSTTTI